MAGKKVTIKDVAREAGVSVATVSYVVNGRTDLKISDETRKRVLQVINLLNYSPNQAAKALASKRKSQVGFAISDSSSILKIADQMHVMKTIAAFMGDKNYDVFLIPPSRFENYGQADALICYDLDKKTFASLGDCNFAPLLAFDCYINDSLFFQINTNLNRLKAAAEKKFKGAPYQYVMLETPNTEKKEFTNNTFDSVIYIDNPSDFDKLSCDNLLVSSEVLLDFVPKKYNVCYEPDITTDKLELLYKAYEQAAERIPIENHNLCI
ncbi:regulatory protein, lacI family [Pseudobutyrivibrio sp. 49]|uniref:LacI family DNA-binding transcriptional regulator n=1 Tax=unclassified Pseudobutyrivibrio TaxID=2638619 RepID=UPI000883BFC8|nr:MULTISPECIES: LacI family DNA-binding transcriptional regulator [unclassified Pseudobutyrivibrio]SDI12912.1 regulatory protein, lacI family [Pseudobutyrivibrio sp. 49]SFN65633.1 regulatory protein, lacI family [Pseudobutyrivibrio sp. UC1225]